MKIGFDIQPIIEEGKSGIGYYATAIVETLMRNYSKEEYWFNYFSFRHREEKDRKAGDIAGGQGYTQPCRWCSGFLFKVISGFIPIPYRIFFGKKVDIMHFFNYHIPPGVKAKKIVTIHDMAIKEFPETVRLRTKVMLGLNLKRTIQRADLILTISEFSKREIEKYYNIKGKEILVVPCGVEKERFNKDISEARCRIVKEKYKLNESYFLYLGTLEPRKNIVNLVKAYSIAQKKNQNIPELVIAGKKGWMYNEIFECVQKLELDTKVVFTGYVDEEEVPALMKGARAFMFPSLYEGFGMPPLEAMACGTPVMTSNTSSLPEVTGDAAKLINPLDVEEMAEGILDFAFNNELCRELSEKGLKRAEQFSWEDIVQNLHEIYRDILK